MIDAACGGALKNKTMREIKELISIMAANSQQFGSRQEPNPKRVNEVTISNLEHQVSNLTSLV